MEITDKKKRNILIRLYSIALMKIVMGGKPSIPIPKFKHIIGCQKIRRKEWLKLAKEFQDEGLLEIHGTRSIHLKLDWETLSNLYLKNFCMTPSHQHRIFSQNYKSKQKRLRQSLR